MEKKRNKLVSKKILLTGGHAGTTAISIIEELIRENAESMVDKKGKNKSSFIWDIYWVGTRRAIEGRKTPTLESKALPKLKIKEYGIISGRLQRKLSFWTLPSLAKIPIGFFHAALLIRRIKPDIVLSFGGFAAFPVVLMAYLSKVPIVVHEQTMAFGRANKFSSYFARKIALARAESRKYFPKDKCIIVGNPIMTQIREVRPKMLIGEPPTIFIMGGSRGSQRVNSIVEEVLPELLREYLVIHHTGFPDFERFEKLRNLLPVKLQRRYEIYKMIDPMQIDGIYKQADMIISRAGANTVAEIIATKRPAILIPLPFSYHNEQRKNAEFAERYQIARALEQENLTGKILFREIKTLRKNWSKIVEKANLIKSPDLDATHNLVKVVKEITH